MEVLVHSLEHGRITVQYGPDVPDESWAASRRCSTRTPSMILVPDQGGMEYAVAATAWTDEDGAGPKPSYGRLLGWPRVQPPDLRRAPSLPRLLPRPRPEYSP